MPGNNKPIHNQQQTTPNNEQVKTVTKITKIITNYSHTKRIISIWNNDVIYQCI